VQLGRAGILNRRHKDCDDGFSLVELVVAMFIIGGVLLSLVTLQTKAMVSIAQAKERQQATAIANEVLEKLRALPWNSIIKGPSSYENKYIYEKKLTIPDEPITGEPIIERSGAITVDDPAYNSPLNGEGGTNLTVHTDPALPGFEFRAYSFVTQPDGAGTPYNITVVVEWDTRDGGSTKQVLARTTAFNTSSSTSCGSDETQPYPTACQDFYTASASAKGPSITVEGAHVVREGDDAPDGIAPILDGSNVASISLSSSHAGITIDSTQSTRVRSTFKPGTLTSSKVSDGEAHRTELPEQAAQASDSVSSSAPTDESASGNGGAFGPVHVSGTDATLSVSAAIGTHEAGAYTEAGCGSLAGTDQPCGTSSGDIRASQVVLSIGSEDLVLASLSSASSLLEVSAARFPGGTSPVSGSLCMDLSGSGCIEATAHLKSYLASFFGVGTIKVPETISMTARGPIHWNENPSVIRSNTNLQTEWSGSHSITATTNEEFKLDVDAAPLVIYQDGDLEVLAKPRFVVSGVQEDSSGDAECREDPCQARAEVPSIKVEVTYTIEGVDSPSSFVVTTKLGSVSSSATYTAHPEPYEDD